MLSTYLLVIALMATTTRPLSASALVFSPVIYIISNGDAGAKFATVVGLVGIAASLFSAIVTIIDSVNRRKKRKDDAIDKATTIEEIPPQHPEPGSKLSPKPDKHAKGKGEEKEKERETPEGKKRGEPPDHA